MGRPSLAPCDEMIRKAEEKNVLLAVDFSRRYETGLLSLKAALDRNRLPAFGFDHPGELVGPVRTRP